MRIIRAWVYFASTLCLGLVLGHQATAVGQEYRSINGADNNLSNPAFGEADTELLRLVPNAYEDGISTPRGGTSTSSLPSARAISNSVSAQTSSVSNSIGASDWIWQWGQFLDHDIDLSGGAAVAEPFDITVPTGDQNFDPTSSGGVTIGLNRTISTGGSAGSPRQQINEITSFIDASNVYGSDLTRSQGLRDLSSNGLLRTSAGNNLPFNTTGLENDNGPGIPPTEAFVAGDVRANEQVGLTATHTLFMREHNRIATDLAARLANNETALVNKRDAAIALANNSVNDEADFIYQSARKLVGAQIQQVTYGEFLPVLLGTSAPSAAASSYDQTIDAGISNEFSTAAFRVGHTLLSPNLQLVDPATGANIGQVSLRDSFFDPTFFDNNSIENVLAGLAQQTAQEVDMQVIDDVRNFLFGLPGQGGFDLASLNIQRGRDHGLDSINATRQILGLTTYSDFLDLTGGDAALAAAFGSVYNSIDDVDLWIGGLAEAHIDGGMVGETFNSILADQFVRTRDGDRFFYESEMDHLLMLDSEFESTLLSDIILRNTSIVSMQSNVFAATTVPEPCSSALVLGLGAVVLARRRRMVSRSNARL